MLKERALFKVKSAIRHPRARPALSEGIVSVSRRFHSLKPKEAVLIALYKKPASHSAATSLVPSETDLVLLAKKVGSESFLSGKFALLGGIVEAEDLRDSGDYLGVLHKALLREVKEEAGLESGDIAFTYHASFHDRFSSFLVHCFSGYLVSDPQSDISAQHLAHAKLKPSDGEHESFSWIPVQRAFSSRQVASIAKRAIDLTLS